MTTATVPPPMATTAAIFPHLPGCPVRANPTDPALAARVETYQSYPPGMDTRDGKVSGAYAIVVTHCHSCGAMTHQR